MDEEIWVEYHRNYWTNQTGVCKLRNIYEVSNFGRVRINGKIVELKTKDRYYGAPGKYKGERLRLHVLVALIFVPNQDPIHKTQVDHIDGNKLNNRADNLRWVTPKENMANPNTVELMNKIWSSEEWKNRCSINAKHNWESEEYRENVTNHNKETKNTPEYKQRLADYWESETGIQQKQTLSEMFSGEGNPMYGKNSEDYMTEEAIILKRQKMKEAQNKPETKALKSQKMKKKDK